MKYTFEQIRAYSLPGAGRERPYGRNTDRQAWIPIMNEKAKMRNLWAASDSDEEVILSCVSSLKEFSIFGFFCVWNQDSSSSLTHSLRCITSPLWSMPVFSSWEYPSSLRFALKMPPIWIGLEKLGQYVCFIKPVSSQEKDLGCWSLYQASR